MNINSIYSGENLNADDLQGREVPVVIESVHLVEFEDAGRPEKKVSLDFRGKQKRLILNKTNATTIAGLYGPETDNWVGRTIILFPTQTDFAGKPVKCIRVKMAMTEPVAPVGTSVNLATIEQLEQSQQRPAAPIATEVQQLEQVIQEKRAGYTEINEADLPF